MVIPLLQDKCIGVFDLKRRVDAFKKSDAEVLTLLASQAAVAIENTRLCPDHPGQRGANRKELRSRRRSRRCFRPSCPNA